MCTAAAYQADSFYFGRTLDHDVSYGEAVVITPRAFPLPFCTAGMCEHHYAIIGMASVQAGYPLYYDAANEKGLAMAGLNFPGNACYGSPAPGGDNIAQFEFLPWLLCQCATLAEARTLLARIHLTDTPFSPALPAAPLHWLIADKTGAITVEAVREGLRIYDNPVGVLTNNPPFPMQMHNLSRYLSLSPKPPVNRFAPELSLQADSLGMGALGLPGDLSSQSRFVRAAFTKLHACPGASESENVGQFFHILGTVAQTRGCCELADGRYETTRYTACCNASRGIYYYTTYGNRQITAVDLHRENLDGAALVQYPLIDTEQIHLQNA